MRRSLKGFVPNSSSPREDIDSNNSVLRQRSRMLYMASPIAASAINTTRTNVVGTGLLVQPTPDATVLGLSHDELQEWQKQVETEFRLWAENRRACDSIGVSTFYELQEIAIRSWLLNGDVFVLIQRTPSSDMYPYTLRLQLIEADRISTPFQYGGYIPGYSYGRVPAGMPGAGNRVYDGVEVDESGQVVAYHICSCFPNEILPDQPMTWQRVLAIGDITGTPNILHVMQSERAGSYRGVPYLAQAIESLLQLRRYTESELMAALVQTYFSAWVYTETNQAEMPFGEVGAGDLDLYSDGSISSDVTGTISDNDNEYEMGPGTVTHLGKDEKVAFANPTIPTAGYETFAKAIEKMIGSGLEIPYEVLMHEFSSSYSASRGALLEAWKSFRMRRRWLVDDFCTPIYQIFLSEAVASGRIKAPGFFTDPKIRAAWCKAQWIGPAQDSLDPMKEAQAALLQVQQGLKTRTQITREMTGEDWEANIAQLTREQELMEQAGLSINNNGGSGQDGSIPTGTQGEPDGDSGQE